MMIRDYGRWFTLDTNIKNLRYVNRKLFVERESKKILYVLKYNKPFSVIFTINGKELSNFVKYLSGNFNVFGQFRRDISPYRFADLEIWIDRCIAYGN